LDQFINNFTIDEKILQETQTQTCINRADNQYAENFTNYIQCTKKLATFDEKTIDKNIEELFSKDPMDVIEEIITLLYEAIKAIFNIYGDI
jgi:hypothetical protein